MQYRFQHAVVGGTFDRFHLGHQKLLTTAFEQSEKVTIGIATQKLFINKSLSQLIEDYTDRKHSVSKFLSEKRFASRSEIIPIHDIFGNSLSEEYIDAIFVTETTRPNALKINEERKKRELKMLTIITVPFVLGNDDEIISSERIRQGMIDRNGNAYLKLFTVQDVFHLPEQAREALREPVGRLFTDMHDVVSTYSAPVMLTAVGDIVAESLLSCGRQADVSIVDGKTRRHALEKNVADTFAGTKILFAANTPGTIAQNAAMAIVKTFNQYHTSHEKQLVVVSGEEDLLAVPAILLSPLESIVVYGQFDKGIVAVEVTEQNKKRVQNLFGKFQ